MLARRTAAPARCAPVQSVRPPALPRHRHQRQARLPRRRFLARSPKAKPWVREASSAAAFTAGRSLWLDRSGSVRPDRRRISAAVRTSPPRARCCCSTTADPFCFGNPMNEPLLRTMKGRSPASATKTRWREAPGSPCAGSRRRGRGQQDPRARSARATARRRLIDTRHRGFMPLLAAEVDEVFRLRIASAAPGSAVPGWRSHRGAQRCVH